MRPVARNPICPYSAIQVLPVVWKHTFNRGNLFQIVNINFIYNFTVYKKKNSILNEGKPYEVHRTYYPSRLSQNKIITTSLV